MQTKKSYSFVVFESERSTVRAVDSLQGMRIIPDDENASTELQISFYLFPVDAGLFLFFLVRNQNYPHCLTVFQNKQYCSFTLAQASVLLSRLQLIR